ncbi:MAG: bifunctional 2-polyprenyl-6-hydroxyphenol methylase/3-demethylubiquinol 3-O-methyltransferase UbiG [Pseudomonadota bacterium]
MADATRNADPSEVAKFDALASRWWDPDGEFKPLHEINPLRLGYVAQFAALDGAGVVDIGCGGGILSEALARRGASVTGIDMAGEALAVARLHAQAGGLDIDYRQGTAEEFANERPGSADVVTCMELLEHVPEPGRLVAACAELLRPGGWVIFSTINRNPKAYALAVLAAEYLLRLLPRGTHDYDRFLKPSELGAFARDAGLEVRGISGIRYNPLTSAHALADDTDVNYLLAARRPADDG